MVFHELPDSVKQGNPQCFCPTDIRTAELLACFGVPDHRVFDQVTVLFQMLLVHDFIKPGSPGFENVICFREIRQGIVKNTTKGFKMLSVRFRVSRVLRSTGSPPKSLLQATRTPLKSRSNGCANGSPDSESLIGALGSGPAKTLSSKAALPPFLPGDLHRKLFHGALEGQLGTLPSEGLNPTTLL